MHYGSRIWKRVAITLLILNAGFILSVLLLPFDRMDRNPEEHENPGTFLVEKLHFSQKQVQAFEVLKKIHHEKVDILMNEGRNLHDEYFKTLQFPQTEDSVIALLAEKISLNQKKIELVTYNHFKQVRALCDERQKNIFDSIIGEVLRKMAGGPKPPGEHRNREEHD